MSNPDGINILLTSVGRRSYVVEYFKDALRGIGSIHVCNSSPTISFQSADASFVAPAIHDGDYIWALLEYCKKNSITAILSLFDIDLPVLAKHRKAFSDIGTKVVLADEEAVSICNDKWKTYDFLLRNDIKTPRTYLRLADAKEAIDAGELMFPVVIKPRWGMGSIGIHVADNENELDVLYSITSKDILNSYLKYESAADPANAVLFQQGLKSQEHGLDVLNDLEGNYISTYAKKKVFMRAGETDLGQIVQPTPFEEIARKISNRIKHEAVLSVDCFVCESGIYVTELNCRISGHYPVSHLAGVDIPKQIVKWLQGKGTDKSLLICKEGIRVTKDLVPRILRV